MSERPSEEEIARVRRWDEETRSRKRAEAEVKARLATFQNLTRLQELFVGRRIMRADAGISSHPQPVRLEVRDLRLEFDDGSVVCFEVEWDSTAVELLQTVPPRPVPKRGTY